LAFHDVPELRVVEMEVPLVCFRRRRRTAHTNQVGKAAIVGDEGTGSLSTFDDLSLEIKKGFVLVVVSAAACKRDRHKLDTADRCRLVFAIVGIKDTGSRNGYFKSERWLVSYSFHLEWNPVRHLYQKTLCRYERLLTVDCESNLAILHDPPCGIVCIESGWRALPRRHRDVLGFQVCVIDNRDTPALLACVLSHNVRQLPVRFVGRRIRSEFRRLGGQRRYITSLSADARGYRSDGYRHNDGGQKAPSRGLFHLNHASS